MKTKLFALAAIGLLALPMAASAAPVSFGALSSDDGGGTNIITDSLNNYEWLRWDTLSNLSYADTLAAISPGGAFAGWQMAHNTEAQLFTNALLSGLSNACTTVGSDDCNSVLPNNLTYLLGDTSSGLFDTVYFLSDNGGDEAGYLRYTSEGDFGGLSKSNIGASIEGDTADDNVGWLLYRAYNTTPPPTHVPEPSALALFAAGFAGLALIRRRRA
jgi:hypothetical protein